MIKSVLRGPPTSSGEFCVAGSAVSNAKFIVGKNQCGSKYFPPGEESSSLIKLPDTSSTLKRNYFNVSGKSLDGSSKLDSNLIATNKTECRQNELAAKNNPDQKNYSLSSIFSAIHRWFILPIVRFFSILFCCNFCKSRNKNNIELQKSNQKITEFKKRFNLFKNSLEKIGYEVFKQGKPDYKLDLFKNITELANSRIEFGNKNLKDIEDEFIKDPEKYKDSWESLKRDASSLSNKTLLSQNDYLPYFILVFSGVDKDFCDTPLYQFGKEFYKYFVSSFCSEESKLNLEPIFELYSQAIDVRAQNSPLPCQTFTVIMSALHYLADNSITPFIS